MNFQWSHSSLNQYKTCPFRYYMTRVVKAVKEEANEAAIWGNRVHKALEDEITGAAPINPESEYAQYGRVLKQVQRIPGEMHAEEKLAVDRKLNPVSFDSPDAWARGIIDVHIRSTDELSCVFDWKTGKVKYDNEQLYVNSLLVFANYPSVNVVKGAYIWLKFSQLTKFNFERKNTSWGRYITEASFIENSFANNFWPKRRSGLCRRHCPVHSCENNGYFAGKN